MFSLKNLGKISQDVKQSFKSVEDTQAVIYEIHNSFDTASEKLLNDAREILSGNYDIEKGERLKNIGFVSAKKAVEASEIILKRQINEKLAKLIEYYQLHYPNNKFITEEKTEEICKKYGLLCADVAYYISDVPEKNLTEIENFKLRQEDMKKFECGWLITEMNHTRISRIRGNSNYYGYFSSHVQSFKTVPEGVEEAYESPPLKICASVKDFNTKNMRIESGYKLELNLPDPIVLQPVKGGYLVVSKWGLEGEDADLTNEKMN